MYFVAAETSGVGTVGKRLTGLKVVSIESGLPPDCRWASFRYLVKVATLLLLGGVLFGWVFLDWVRLFSVDSDLVHSYSFSGSARAEISLKGQGFGAAPEVGSADALGS